MKTPAPYKVYSLAILFLLKVGASGFFFTIIALSMWAESWNGGSNSFFSTPLGIITAICYPIVFLSSQIIPDNPVLFTFVALIGEIIFTILLGLLIARGVYALDRKRKET